MSQHASNKRKEYTPAEMQDYFPAKKSTTQITVMYKARATWYEIDQVPPFSTFDKPLFRAIFAPLYINAKNISAAANTHAMREEVYTHGVMAKDAVVLEIGTFKGWSSDHWTAPSRETYTTATHHYIENNW